MIEEVTCRFCEYWKSNAGKDCCTKNAPGPNGYAEATMTCQEFKLNRDHIKDADCCHNCTRRGWKEPCDAFTVGDEHDNKTFTFKPYDYEICEFFQRRIK